MQKSEFCSVLLEHFCDVVYEDFKILKVDLEAETKAIETEGAGQSGYASVSFIQWVMYWYFTIESTVEAIREMHTLTATAMLGREHEKAAEVDSKLWSIEVSHGNLSERKARGYHVLLNSGDSFAIKQQGESEKS
ncbi:MAG: hypothetical protein IT419_17525 [Planctomycetes bacterium]|nr:hypothetical protein [Planctomycetota bacterium]